MTTPATKDGPRWAVRSKADGAAGEYRIVADDSGLRRATEYADLIQRMVIGSPTTTRDDTVDSFPWVVVGANGHGRSAVVIQEWPEPPVRDSSGRPVTRTRYFDVPWTNHPGVGFADLYRAFHPQHPANDGVAEFVPTRLDPRHLAHYIDRAGFDWLAWVAASLPSNKVILTGPSDLTIEQRLMLFDAVFALLPYGFRVNTAVATWANPQGTNQFTLSCGQSERAGHLVLPVASVDLPAIQDPTAREYFERLRRLRKSHGIHELVSELLNQQTPTETGIDKVIEALTPLDRPAAAIYAIHAGRASADDIRLLLEREEEQFDDDQLRTIARFCSTSANRPTWAVWRGIGHHRLSRRPSVPPLTADSPSRTSKRSALGTRHSAGAAESSALCRVGWRHALLDARRAPEPSSNPGAVARGSRNRRPTDHPLGPRSGRPAAVDRVSLRRTDAGVDGTGPLDGLLPPLRPRCQRRH